MELTYSTLFIFVYFASNQLLASTKWWSWKLFVAEISNESLGGNNFCCVYYYCSCLGLFGLS